jgi:hypothetical protein
MIHEGCDGSITGLIKFFPNKNLTETISQPYFSLLLRRVAFPDFCEPCLPSPAAKPPAAARNQARRVQNAGPPRR